MSAGPAIAIGSHRGVVGGLGFFGGEIIELAVDAFGIEPAHPPAGLDLEIVEAFPVAADPGEHGRVAVELGLEQGVHRLGHRIVITVGDRADRWCGADVVETLGVGDRSVLTSRAEPVKAFETRTQDFF